MAFTIADVNEEIRFLLGDLPLSSISDENLNRIIQKSVDRYSLEDEDFCIVTYESLLASLQWLVNKEQATSSTSGGQISQKKEKVGDIGMILADHKFFSVDARFSGSKVSRQGVSRLSRPAACVTVHLGYILG